MFSILRDYGVKLAELTARETSLGLAGKLGTAIYFLEYSRISTDQNFLLIGEQLISEVLEDMSLDTCTFNYRNGILGIGTGIAYLYDRQFIQGESDEVLSEIDELVHNAVNFRTIEKKNLSTDLIGLLYYLYLRVKGREEPTLSRLKNQEHLIYAIDWLENLWRLGEIAGLKVYTILSLLHSIKVYPTKTELLLKEQLEILSSDSNYNVYSEIDLLENRHLSILQTWIRHNN